MPHFTFEGDFKKLGEPQIRLVEDVLEKQGFNDGTVSVEPVGQKGDNFIAHVKRFICKDKNGTTFKMIGKIAPVNERLRMSMSIPVLFKNETIMYNEVIPILRNIQVSADITGNDIVKFPICYGIVTESPFECILLEDLKESDFEMLDRFKPLPNEGLRLALKYLAELHSLSFAFKSTEPETYKNITEEMVNLWAERLCSPKSQRFLEATENDLLKLMRESDSRYAKVINGSLTQISTLAKKMEFDERASKYSVIQHGDCWINNMLFRLEDGKPVQNVMIDYQLSREGNPAADILYMLFNCSDHPSRLNHFTEWIEYYHECLDTSLQNYDLTANHVFPKEQLDADLKRYGRLMVSICLMGATMMMREAVDVVDFKDKTNRPEQVGKDTIAQMSIDVVGASTARKLKERVTDIIDTALEFGLI